jgi:phospholipid transport system substrate-binding protein
VVYVTLALAFLLLCGTGAWAATPTETLRQVFARADRILTDPETEDRPVERLTAIRKLINDALDFRETAALAFGRHWPAATPAEQTELTELLADMLERSYLSRLAAQASLEGGAQIQYLGESVEDGEALVWTTVARRNGGQIPLGYRMIERDGRWKVRDVIVDGVSVAANYRAQIERVLEVASVAELLAQMRDKTGRVEPPARPPSIADAAPPPAPVAETSTPVLTAVVEPARAEPVVSAPAPIASPATVAAAPPARAASRVTKAYWLRLGTLEAIEASGRLESLLDERKLVVAVEPAGGGGRAFALNVRVGPFNDATDAVLKLLELQQKGHDPALVAERE